MMALEDVGGSMLKTRLPHSRRRKDSVDLADAGVLVRAKARIGLKNLAYNMRRLVQLERHAMAGAS